MGLQIHESTVDECVDDRTIGCLKDYLGQVCILFVTFWLVEKLLSKPSLRYSLELVGSKVNLGCHHSRSACE